MEEQKGFFGLLDKYLMGPMSVIAQFKVVRAYSSWYGSSTIYDCWINVFGIFYFATSILILAYCS